MKLLPSVQFSRSVVSHSLWPHYLSEWLFWPCTSHLVIIRTMVWKIPWKTQESECTDCDTVSWSSAVLHRFWNGMYNRFEKGLQPRQSVTDYLMAVKEETQQLEEELEALEEVRQSLLLTLFADDCSSGKSLLWLRMCEMQQHSHFIFLCSVVSNSLRPHGLVC